MIRPPSTRRARGDFRGRRTYGVVACQADRRIKRRARKITSPQFHLRPSTIYTIRYFDRLGDHHEMTATYLGNHKFGGTSWSFRPLPGVKNLVPGGILAAAAQAAGTDPVQSRPIPRAGC